MTMMMLWSGCGLQTQKAKDSSQNFGEIMWNCRVQQTRPKRVCTFTLARHARHYPGPGGTRKIPHVASHICARLWIFKVKATMLPGASRLYRHLWCRNCFPLFVKSIPSSSLHGPLSTRQSMVPLPRVCVLLLGIPILYSRFVKFRSLAFQWPMRFVVAESVICPPTTSKITARPEQDSPVFVTSVSPVTRRRHPIH